MEVLSILPTPVAIIPCPFADKVKETVLDHISKEDVLNLDYNIDSGNLKHIGHYSILMDDKRYGRLRSWMEEQALIFARDVKGDYIQEHIQVTDSWFNISGEGAYQHPHCHGNSYLSGVYYVNFDDTKGHVNTHFTNSESLYQQYKPSLINLPVKYTDYNQDNKVISNEGELLLFPSQVIHGYNLNKGENRITIAMNFMPTVLTNGDYGWRVVNLTQEERERAFNARKGLKDHWGMDQELNPPHGVSDLPNPE